MNNSVKEIRTQQANIRRQVLKLVDRCAYCDDDTKEILQVHHIVPVADGGTNCVDNLVVLCPNCHVKAHRGIISIEELKSCADTEIIKKACDNIRKSGARIPSKIEEIIRKALAYRGLKLSELARELQTQPQNLSQRIKRGSITYDEAVKFAEKLGYDIEWLKKN